MSPYRNNTRIVEPRTYLGGKAFSSAADDHETSDTNVNWEFAENLEAVISTVLIVNAIPDQLRFMGELLRRSAYRVLTALNEREGIKIAQTVHPDLVISGILTPRMDGFEMRKLMREHDELRDTPVLLITVDVQNSQDMIASLKVGVDDYLEMPYDPMRLITKVAQLIEHSHVSRALHESEAKYQELVENLNDVIFALDEDGLLAYISPVIEPLTGYHPSELVGRSFKEFIFADDVPAVQRSFRQVLSHQLGPLEYRIQTRSGEVVWVRTSSRPTVVGGRVVGIRGMMTNITDRKRAEEALKASEAELRALFGAMTDVILVLDAEGRYLKIAPTDPSYLYRSPAELVGKTLHEVFPKPQADFFLSHVRRALSEAQLHRLEYELETEKGKIQFEGSVSPLSTSSVLWIARDITEQKRTEVRHRELEKQLRQSQKMEAIGKLAGGVAHDFNNLLTAILGYGDLTLERLPQDSALRRNVEEVIKAGQRAASLTRQLLAFSRQQVLQPVVLDINSLVLNLSKMLKRLIGEDIEFITSLKPEAGRINADLGQIEQVLMNLVINARDAMPRGGKLVIETDNAELDQAYADSHVGVRAGSYVMLAVSDNGAGMDEQTRSRIFEPFFTTKEPGKGTGLGLAMVYGTVKQSGGNIWVYSEPDRGTTFKLYLPRVAEQITETKSSPERKATLRGSETVLLVEDAELVRNLARDALEIYGYKVLEAASGSAALAISDNYDGQIHLLLTDVVMPGMSGRKTADRLLESRPEMKVLFMSGYTDDAIVHHGVLDADTPFIQKPFPPQFLAQKVRDVLDS